MAAKEVVNTNQRDIELVVNRWLLDYYFSLGLEFFQNDKKEDFMGIIEVFESTYQMSCQVSSLAWLSMADSP